MIDKAVFKKNVVELLSLAKARNTNQGVMVYNKVLERIDLAQDESELKEILESLNVALT